MKNYRMTFARRRWADENHDAIVVDFDSTESFSFVPGQYIRVQLIDSPIKDEHGDARIFNIASPPSQSDRITIVTRLRNSAFKRNLRDLPIGTPVQISSALGDFILHKNTEISVVFLVGGTGIAPVIAMLHDLQERRLPYHVSLFYSNKTIGRTVFHQELEEWHRSALIIRYVRTLTQTELSPSAYFSGRINEQMVRANLSTEEIGTSQFYITGPWGMGESMTTALLSLDVPHQHIHVKEFDLKWLEQ